MKNNSFQKRLLASGSALQVLAMAGGGLAVASIAAPAAAQDYTAGAISGTVVDDAGAPVAGATVSATSVSQGFTRTATTGTGAREVSRDGSTFRSSPRTTCSPTYRFIVYRICIGR